MATVSKGGKGLGKGSEKGEKVKVGKEERKGVEIKLSMRGEGDD